MYPDNLYDNDAARKSNDVSLERISLKELKNATKAAKQKLRGLSKLEILLKSDKTYAETEAVHCYEVFRECAYDCALNGVDHIDVMSITHVPDEEAPYFNAALINTLYKLLGSEGFMVTVNRTFIQASHQYRIEVNISWKEDEDF